MDNFVVILGEYDLVRPDPYETMHRIYSVHFHPDFQHGVYDQLDPNDLVLVEMSPAATVGENVQMVCIPEEDRSPASPVCYTSGWRRGQESSFNADEPKQPPAGTGFQISL